MWPASTLQTCPNCGAPLQLDREGVCTFCRARITYSGSTFADLPAPSRPLLRIATSLSAEPAAERVLESTGVAGSTDALLDAVAAAGRRVLDDGLILDERRVDFKVYRSEEMWAFNLAADLVALLAAAPNLPKAKRAAMHDLLLTVDAGLGSHWSRSTIGNAGAGPESFRELRDAIPHRKLIRP